MSLFRWINSPQPVQSLLISTHSLHLLFQPVWYFRLIFLLIISSIEREKKWNEIKKHESENWSLSFQSHTVDINFESSNGNEGWHRSGRKQKSLTLASFATFKFTRGAALQSPIIVVFECKLRRHNSRFRKFHFEFTFDFFLLLVSILLNVCRARADTKLAIEQN